MTRVINALQRFTSFSLCLIVVYGCKKKDTFNIDTSSYYFKGTVFDEGKYFKDSVARYEAGFEESFGAGSRIGNLRFGMTTHPEQIGDEFIHLVVTNVNVSDYNGINTLFSVGQKSFSSNDRTTGFLVVYDSVYAIDSLYCLSGTCGVYKFWRVLETRTAVPLK